MTNGAANYVNVRNKFIRKLRKLQYSLNDLESHEKNRLNRMRSLKIDPFYTSHRLKEMNNWNEIIKKNTKIKRQKILTNIKKLIKNYKMNERNSIIKLAMNVQNKTHKRTKK